MAGNKEATLWLKIKTAGEEALEAIEEKFDKIKTKAVIAFGIISAALIKSIYDYKESEQTLASLSQAMVNNGIYTKALKDDYLAQADALSKLTTFSDDAIVQAQTAAQQQMGQIPITKELTTAILDFAQAQKMDAASAAELVGKSIGTSTNALGRYGIEVNSTSSKSEKMAQVLDGLNMKFGGQAEAAGKGIGVIDRLKNSIGEVSEEVGRSLAPTLEILANKLLDVTNNASAMSPIVNGISGVFKFISKAILEAGYLVDYFSQQWTIFGTTIGTSFSEAIKGNVSEAIRVFKDGDELMKSNSLALKEKLAADLYAIDNAYIDKKIALEEAERQREAAAKANKAANTLADETTENTRKLEAMIVQQEIEMGVITANEEQKKVAILDAQIKTDQEKLKNATTANAKYAANLDIFRLNELKKTELKHQAEIEMEKKKWESISGIATFASGAITNIMGKDSQAAFIAQKAAAIAQAIVATQQAAAMALTLGPIAGPIMAGVVTGLGYANVAAIAGVRLAEGGIVKATPGGVQATIGEGGQDEMVIPLDRAGEFGLGGGGGSSITINVNGGMLGDERSAHQLAVAIDQQLLKLRQNGESVAFDERIS